MTTILGKCFRCDSFVTNPRIPLVTIQQECTTGHVSSLTSHANVLIHHTRLSEILEVPQW